MTAAQQIGCKESMSKEGFEIDNSVISVGFDYFPLEH